MPPEGGRGYGIRRPRCLMSVQSPKQCSFQLCLNTASNRGLTVSRLWLFLN